MSAQHLQIVPPAPFARPLPASIEAEMGVLGAILINNSALAEVRGLLSPNSFSEPVNRTIFKVAIETIDAGKLVSPITLKAYLGEGEIAPGLSAASYLARLASEATTIINVRHYAELVFDLAQRREMIELAEHLRETAYTAPATMNSASVAYSIVGELQELAAKACPASTRKDIGAAASHLLEHVEAVMNKEAVDTRAPTGFIDLDRHTGGYGMGELWILGARPGQGKTILMTTGSRRAAQLGSGSMEFSFEVPEQQIVSRHLSDLAYRPRNPISYQQIMRGQLSPEDLWCLKDAKKRLDDLPLTIDFASSLSISEIGARVRAEKQRMAQSGAALRVVWLDHMRFIKSEARYAGNANKETGEKTRALKQLAKDEGLCIVLLVQLNRGLEARAEGERRPVLADLRDSGEIEEDADVVLFLHREHYYLIKKPGFRAQLPEAQEAAESAKHKAELIIGKNRAGAERTVDLWCDITASTMDNAESSEHLFR